MNIAPTLYAVIYCFANVIYSTLRPMSLQLHYHIIAIWIYSFEFLSLQLTPDQCKILLIHAICAILTKCKHDKFRIVTLPEEDLVPSSSATGATPVQESNTSQVPAESAASTEPSKVRFFHFLEMSDSLYHRMIML